MKDRDLQSEDYKKFVDKKGISPTCPMCSSKRWSLVGETRDRSYQFPLTPRGDHISGGMQATAFLLLVCDNCAFTAPILREKVVAELDASDA